MKSILDITQINTKSQYSAKLVNAAIPYNLITFLRFCVSSHQSIIHGLNKPISMQAAAVHVR